MTYWDSDDKLTYGAEVGLHTERKCIEEHSKRVDLFTRELVQLYGSI
jgi:hypothetical protein